MSRRFDLRSILGVVALGVAALSFASGPQKGAPTSRVSKIWDIADNRAVQITDIWFTDGEFPKCIQMLKFRADLRPGDYEVFTDLGWMQENVQHWDEALATYIKFKKLNPESPDAPYPEAQFYFMKKAYAKVPPLLEQTLPGKPHPNSYRILAQSYERMGLLQDSRRVWKTYLAWRSDDEAAKNNLARVEKKIKGDAGPPKKQ